MPGFMIAALVVTLLALGVLRALGVIVTRRAFAAFLLLALAAHLGWLSTTTFDPPPNGVAFAGRIFATAWTVACLLTLLLGAPFLVVRSVLAFARRPARPVDLHRRRLFASVVPLAAVATSARGSVGGVSSFIVRQEEVRIDDLPPALDGYKIGQITDVHVGPFITIDELRAAVRAVDDEGVDLVAMTGDLLDDIDQLDACLDALAATTARHGCLAVMGNHEMWRGHDLVLAGYAARRDAGRLRLLTDESVTLDNGLRIVGVDWPSRSRKRGRLQPDERRERMQRSAEVAFAGVDVERDTIVCLSHHPDFFPFAAAKGAALTLAGHTHGGQVAFFGAPLFSFAFDYMLGRFKHALGTTSRQAHLYVGGGMGHWVPYRFGVPTEVTVLTLRRS
jgi:uncharacterized protein